MHKLCISQTLHCAFCSRNVIKIQPIRLEHMCVAFLKHTMLYYTHGWGSGDMHFPQFGLISQYLIKIQKVRSTTPAWPAQPWYATVLKMCIKDPILLLTVPHLLLSGKGEPHPLKINNSLHCLRRFCIDNGLLVWWPVSNTEQSLFPS